MRHSRFYIIGLFWVAFLFTSGKLKSVINDSGSGTNFKVCEVEKATGPLSGRGIVINPYREVVIEKAVHERNRKDKTTSFKTDTTLALFQKQSLSSDELAELLDLRERKIESLAVVDKELIQCSWHPLMATLHMAYAHHYPVTLSPDMIWLLIAQGFATHVNENAEELRDQFVDFDGKKLIDISRPGFSKGKESNDWPGTFAEFSEKIEANTGAELLDLVTGDFSTTGPIEKAAFQVTLMDAMKSYFEYSMTSLCGIPEITLEGTTEDWLKIEAKAKELAQYDLKWWIDDLIPILEEFTKAANGKADKEFWQSIYKRKKQGSGSSVISGWILNFFPYREINGVMTSTKSLNEKYADKGIKYSEQASSADFTSGLSQADFLWNYFGTYYSMELVAGFVGCYQNPKTLSLRPEISWAVIDKQTAPSKEVLETYRTGGNKQYHAGEEKK